ncbi:MAG: tRNA glutamyl-Q(34) synthetase GluQRS [Bryobacteraceae bacterium]
MNPAPPNYRGRFAPSPTGPLHFGSLVAAAASYLDAKAHGGTWIVRMEDVDTGREQPGAAAAILADLENFGLYSDEPIIRQSERTEVYRKALQRLQSGGLVYPCGCTRKEIQDSLVRGESQWEPAMEPRYPGTCSAGLAPGRSPRSWRVRSAGAAVVLEDRLHGVRSEIVADSIGDFVLLRADGVFAYQLAVVVDDADQGITDVVRGADLLGSTPRQIHLQRLLGLGTPRYLHIPVATDAQGYKLSKQTGALPLDARDSGTLITQALAFLGQAPPAGLERAPVAEIWEWAVAAWKPERLGAQGWISNSRT